MKRLCCIVLICILLCGMTGCVSIPTEAAADLMADITPNAVDLQDRAINGEAVTPFAVKLLQASNEEDKNTLLSPISIVYALAMTANGADEATRTQMEQTLEMTVEEMNDYLLLHRRTLAGATTLSLANAIWFDAREGLTVDQPFLQTNADYFGAEIRKAPFDAGTVKDINEWVKTHTDGLIPKLVDELPKNTVMCLLNALAFDAEWQKMYEDMQVREGPFTTADGTVRTVDLMYGTEYDYLEDAKATGFIKYYKDRKYAFAALLPNAGVDINTYVTSLTGEGLSSLLSNPKNVMVHSAIPRFDTAYQADLSAVLESMGIVDAFNEKTANFSKLGSYTGGNLYIGKVLHKTRMSVNERGTKAGAVTAVMMDAGSAIVEYKEVILNRPFVYVLFDCETNLPIFIGTMKDVAQ